MLCVTAVSGQTAPEPALLVWHQHQLVPENWPSAHNSLPFAEQLAIIDGSAGTLQALVLALQRGLRARHNTHTQ